VGRILSPEDLIEWHPLDHKPAPEYIPPYWIGTHAGKRLAEALRTLRTMPINGVPQGFASAWPEYEQEYADLAQYVDDPQWKAEQAAARNWVKITPTSQEVARMETAISWPGRYLGDVPQLLRTVGAVASARARFQDIAAATRKLQLPGRIVRRWNNEGLDLIAAGLRRDEVGVF
jgi:hypothetical protein